MTLQLLSNNHWILLTFQKTKPRTLKKPDKPNRSSRTSHAQNQTYIFITTQSRVSVSKRRSRILTWVDIISLKCIQFQFGVNCFRRTSLVSTQPIHIQANFFWDGWRLALCTLLLLLNNCVYYNIVFVIFCMYRHCCVRNTSGVTFYCTFFFTN